MEEMNRSAAWMSDTPEMLAFIILALLAFVVPIQAKRKDSPVLHIFARWTRWLFFATFFAYGLSFFGLSDRPFWIHWLTGMALWFLLETGFSWMAIRALSFSDYPLFPVFRENHDGDEWPAENRHIAVRDTLRKLGFQRIAALKSTIMDEFYLRVSIYRDSGQLFNVQLYFLPSPTGHVQLAYAIDSIARDGSRLITDNLRIPFGGYYPENWFIVRRPLTTSFKSLINLHKKRMEHSDKQWVCLDDDMIEAMNAQQHELERFNFERGFLVSAKYREEEGKISKEGCYRIWKEKWWMDYFGRTVTI
jgi:hypothetical protein